MRELIRTNPEEMRRFVNEFRDHLYEMPFQLPADLHFLGRCVSILSKMCTGLDPGFNVFEGLRPFAEQLVADEGSIWFSELLKVLVEQGRALISMPSRLDGSLLRMERGEHSIIARTDPELAVRLGLLARAIQRMVGDGIVAALLIAGSLLCTNKNLIEGGVSFGLAILTRLWILATSRKRKEAAAITSFFVFVLRSRIQAEIEITSLWFFLYNTFSINRVDTLTK